MKTVAFVLLSALASLQLSAQSGAMSIVYLDPDTLFGLPGQTFVHSATVTNASSQSLEIHVERTQTLPGDWLTAIAIEQSFPSFISSTNVSLSVGDNPFQLHFSTDSIPAITGVTITLTNLSDTTEQIQKTFYVSTLAQQPNAIAAIPPTRFVVSPNPVQSALHLSHTPVDIYDAVGRFLLRVESNSVDLSGLRSGVYVLRFNGKSKTIVKQ